MQFVKHPVSAGAYGQALRKYQTTRWNCTCRQGGSVTATAARTALREDLVYEHHQDSQAHLDLLLSATSSLHQTCSGWNESFEIVNKKHDFDLFLWAFLSLFLSSAHGKSFAHKLPAGCWVLMSAVPFLLTPQPSFLLHDLPFSKKTLVSPFPLLIKPLMPDLHAHLCQANSRAQYISVSDTGLYNPDQKATKPSSNQHKHRYPTLHSSHHRPGVPKMKANEEKTLDSCKLFASKQRQPSA